MPDEPRLAYGQQQPDYNTPDAVARYLAGADRLVLPRAVLTAMSPVWQRMFVGLVERVDWTHTEVSDGK